MAMIKPRGRGWQSDILSLSASNHSDRNAAAQMERLFVRREHWMRRLSKRDASEYFQRHLTYKISAVDAEIERRVERGRPRFGQVVVQKVRSGTPTDVPLQPFRALCSCGAEIWTCAANLRYREKHDLGCMTTLRCEHHNPIIFPHVCLDWALWLQWRNLLVLARRPKGLHFPEEFGGRRRTFNERECWEAFRKHFTRSRNHLNWLGYGLREEDMFTDYSDDPTDRQLWSHKPSKGVFPNPDPFTGTRGGRAMYLHWNSMADSMLGLEFHQLCAEHSVDPALAMRWRWQFLDDGKLYEKILNHVVEQEQQEQQPKQPRAEDMSNKVKIMTPGSDSHKKLVRSQPRARKYSIDYNEVADLYNNAEVGSILILPESQHLKTSNVVRVLTNRGLSAAEFEVFKARIDADGRSINEPSDRPVGIRKLTSGQMKVI